MERIDLNWHFLSHFNGVASWFKTRPWQSPTSQTLTTLILVATVWILGEIIWLIPNETKAVPTWAAAHVVVSKNESNIDIDSLKQADLFGHYTPNQQTNANNVKVDAPKTRLNLTLSGVVANSDQALSLAVIANRGSQDTYGINEVIQGTRVKLKAVLVDRVILDNEGRDETLMLDGVDYSKLAIDNPQPLRVEPVRNKEVNDESADLQEKLDKIHQEIESDPKVLLKYVRLAMVKEGNDIQGYRLSAGSDRALFDSVGLQDGDVAVSINGVDLKDADALTKVLGALSDTQEINLTVERDNQLEDIQFGL